MSEDPKGPPGPQLDTESLTAVAFAIVEEACRSAGVESIEFGVPDALEPPALVWLGGIGRQGNTLAEAFEDAVKYAAERKKEFGP